AHEPGDIASRRIPPCGEILEQNGHYREEQTKKDRDDEKQICHHRCNEVENNADTSEHVTQRLDQRTERLEQDEVRKSEQSDGAVPWVAEHLSMTPEALDRAALPSVALGMELRQRFGYLRPADRIRHEDD